MYRRIWSHPRSLGCMFWIVYMSLLRKRTFLVILLEPFYYNDQFVALFTKLIAPRKLMSIEGGAYNRRNTVVSIVRVCEKHLICKFIWLVFLQLYFISNVHNASSWRFVLSNSHCDHIIFTTHSWCIFFLCRKALIFQWWFNEYNPYHITFFSFSSWNC